MGLVLAIESSCDDTSIAILSDTKIIVVKTYSQIIHKVFGGVVPELAARSHIEKIELLIEETLKESGLELSDIDYFAATTGPGLIGGLLVGTMTAKALAFANDKGFIPINHLEGHALTVRMTENVELPYLLLLVSGGHCQFYILHDIGEYEKIGATIDDSIGEAFDKVAKMIGLEYPGGPKIEEYALKGDKDRFKFPRSFVGKEGCNFSLSGLKTAVKREVDKLEIITEQDRYDIAASFQETIRIIVCDRVKNAISKFKSKSKGVNFVLSGGVAANLVLRSALEEVVASENMNFFAPPIKYCTDNAAMIAWVAIERLRKGLASNDLSFEPKSKWNLEIENK